MGSRGRTSSAAMEVMTTADLSSLKRPDPPYTLREAECDVWRSVAGNLPADWFSPANYPLLEQYCRHVVAARRIDKLLEECESDEVFDRETYGRILAMQRAESEAIGKLARHMRLTQQATKPANTTRLPKLSRKPWND